MTEWNEDRAREMRRNGASWKAIGDYFGICSSTVHGRLEPEYAAYRKATRSYVSKGSSTFMVSADRGVSKEDIEARMSEIPRDTRNKTQVICGDPVFERSALYAKMMERA